MIFLEKLVVLIVWLTFNTDENVLSSDQVDIAYLFVFEATIFLFGIPFFYFNQKVQILGRQAAIINTYQRVQL